MRRLALVVLLASAACSGDDAGPSGAGDEEEAAEGALDFLEAYADHDAAAVYDALHPLNQEVLDRDDYLECLDEALEGVEVRELAVMDVLPARVHLDGELVDATAVTVRVTTRTGDEQGSFVQPVALLRLDGEWRTVLPDPESFADGGCPVGRAGPI